jgi:hypothetical protein
MTVIPDHEHEHLKLRRIASVLLPGDDTSPPATSVPDYDELLSKAVEVIGAEQPMLTRALQQLPDDADWDALKEFADNEPDGFEVVAAVVSGAYFMSTTVLDGTVTLSSSRQLGESVSEHCYAVLQGPPLPGRDH